MRSGLYLATMLAASSLAAAETPLTIDQLLAYYIAHIYLLHATAILLAWITIGSVAASHKPDGYGLGLAGIYTVWVAVVILLYPLCSWFAAIKRRRTEWWWSYL
jgi:hypothetical protein